VNSLKRDPAVWNGEPTCEWSVCGKSVTVQQNYAAQIVWRDFLSEHDIKLAIEIGTARGGFTAFLEANVKHVHTFDINHPPETYTEGVHYYVEDCFGFSGRSLIHGLCRLPDAKVLFCDGGDKPREIQTFSRYLNSGDFVAVHDYDTDIESFQRRMSWGWLECQQSDVPTGLVPVAGFETTAWGVFEVQ
jgi:hypothetical protein